MLINLTNHPSAQWSNAQLQTAEMHYGEVTDIPFPRIAPDASLAEVQATANEFFNKIVSLRVNKPVAVHLSGEFTFVYTLLNLLYAANIPAFTSTSERLVSVNPDGTKTVTFQFVRFREYYQVEQPGISVE